MIPTVGIVTDSVACLPRHHVHDLGIRVVPVHLLIDDDDRLDGDLDHEDVHRRIAAGARASTATPSAGEFAAAYRELAERGLRAVVAATVSAALSNVHNAARLAAETSPIPVDVIDTRTVACAQGLVVRRLAEEAAAGASAGDVRAAFTAARARVGLVAVVPDLAALARTGRVPSVVARIGDRLDLKPLITIGDDGRAHPAGIARTMDRGIARVVERAATGAGPGRPRIVVMHTVAADAARRVAAALERLVPSAAVEIAPFTAVMGIHTGPGLIGAAWEEDPERQADTGSTV